METERRETFAEDDLTAIFETLREMEQSGTGKARAMLETIKTQTGQDLRDKYAEWVIARPRGKPPDEPNGYAPEDVMEMLKWNISYGKDGKAKDRRLIQSVRNWEIVFENDQRFVGKIRYDIFNMQICMVGNLPWEQNHNFRTWTDCDDSETFSLIQFEYGLQKRQDCLDALRNVANRNSFHPVRDYLDALKWDGQEHIENLAIDYLGAENTKYNKAIMRLWFLQGAGRIYQPGCKADYTLLFVGKQGIGKSTFFRLAALNDHWFCDSLDDLSSKDASLLLIGTWIVELAELKSLSRTSGGADSVKRFLTAQSDKVRLPYERRVSTYQRGCIFGASSNKENALDDPTGNRRFLICYTGTNEPAKDLFRPEALDDFKQAWAQAVQIWKTEKPKLVLQKEFAQQARELQDACTNDAGEVGLIRSYLEDKIKVCALEIWRDALHENGRPSRFEASRINDIVAGTPGWRRASSPTRFGKYGSQRGFYKMEVCSAENKDQDGKFSPIDKDDEGYLPFT